MSRPLASPRHAAPRGSAVALRSGVVALVVALLASIFVASAGAARERTDLEWKAEQMLLDLHNQERVRRGIPALVEHRDVREVARNWNDGQAARRKLQHNPNYRSEVCCHLAVAENVAYRFIGRTLDEDSVRKVITAMHVAYMGSSGHSKNILGSAYDDVGIAMTFVKDGSNWTVYSTTNFREDDGTAPGTGIPSARDVTDTCGEAGEPSFTDVPAGNVHAANIACLEREGITTGKADGTYGPKEFLSRGQIATFLMRTLEAAGKQAPVGSACPDGVHAEGMSAMRAWGIFTTDDCDERSQVLRWQMATWSVRALQGIGLKAPPAEADYFNDDNAMGGDVQGANNAIAAWGVVTGTGNDHFAPTSPLRRDQMATFLARLLDVARA